MSGSRRGLRPSGRRRLRRFCYVTSGIRIGAEALSNGWCSLKPGEDRPVLAVRTWIDSQGNKMRHEFMRGLFDQVLLGR